MSGRRGDILNLDTNVYTTAEVSDVTQGGHLDGFFVALDAETSTLKISALDGKTWDPTQIAQRTAAADLWEALIIVEREIFLFGPKTGEVWYNAGATPFPFAQRRGTEFDTGIAATFSLAKFGATCAWLGKSDGGYGVYVMNRYTPEKISSAGLDWLIGQFAESGGIADAIGWSYAKEGHSFYCCTSRRCGAPSCTTAPPGSGTSAAAGIPIPGPSMCTAGSFTRTRSARTSCVTLRATRFMSSPRASTPTSTRARCAACDERCRTGRLGRP